MQKQLWKQILSVFLIIAMTGIATIPAQGATNTKTDAVLADEIVTYEGETINTIGLDNLSNNYFERLLNGQSEYDVTEEEIAAFEKEYEEKHQQVIHPMTETESTEAAEVAEFARKKAAVLTGLYGLDSVQYALIEDGQITVSGSAGYSDKAKKQEPDTSTMYGIASISKIFTTTAVLQLVEEGKVNLDAPVTTYIPEFRMADKRYQDITVKMLLNHTSGIQGGSLNSAVLLGDNDTINHDNLLGALREQRLKANPGEYSVYCNDGFSLAEILVERVTGQSFSEYVAENMTGPLELTGTKTPQDSFETDKLAGIYAENTKLPIECFNAIGTGGFYSTAENLCHFAEVFMDNSNKTEILSNSSVVSMATKTQQGTDWIKLNSLSDGYGLGWDSVNAYPFNEYGMKALTKGGDSGFYHGSLIVLPEQNKAVAVLSSAGSSSIDQIFAAAILLEALSCDGTITETSIHKVSYEKPQRQAIPSELLAYEGYYITMGGILEIEMDSGILTMRNIYAPKNKAELIYTGNGKFRDAMGTSELEFITEGNGKQYMWGGSYASLPTIGNYFAEYYQAYKITNHKIAEPVKKAWKARENQLYFVINEKYSSTAYIEGGLVAGLTLSKQPEGYMGYSKIIDKNTAITDIILPGMLGRDLQDYKFYKEDGIEYVKIHDFVAISEKDVKALSSKNNYSITIGKDGYAKWYKINGKTVGKVMTVTVPENGSFAVYDKDGACKIYSYVSDKTKITLPKGGYVVFAGDAKAKFTVNISTSQ